MIDNWILVVEMYYDVKCGSAPVLMPDDVGAMGAANAVGTLFPATSAVTRAAAAAAARAAAAAARAEVAAERPDRAANPVSTVDSRGVEAADCAVAGSAADPGLGPGASPAAWARDWPRVARRTAASVCVWGGDQGIA